MLVQVVFHEFTFPSSVRVFCFLTPFNPRGFCVLGKAVYTNYIASETAFVNVPPDFDLDRRIVGNGLKFRWYVPDSNINRTVLGWMFQE
ncbi:hypothetical protein C486_13777 [Natrinema gari JCM 14663]|uniref:Uncharacterized protein n=1 Tax=Natrinema gari JCM 14663 TaxID=1230459 RepID=L9YUS2_9EURY|nr:hypothetical protein C486_13777 [Natrinema gari JCM 14663]